MQTNAQTSSIENLFNGKSVVTNLYSKALKVVKDKETSSTSLAFDKLLAYFFDCPALTQKDIINILYNSNFSFRNTFSLLLPSSTKIPTSGDISSTYNKIYACRHIQNPTVTDIDNINTEVNTRYLALYANAFTIASLNNANFWSDLFRNGTLDDSDFDLLYDINQIGKILFDSFKETPQLLYYRLPASQQSSSQNNNTPSSAQQNAYQLGWGGWSFGGSSWLSGWSSSPISTSTSSTTTAITTATATASSNAPALDDKEVQNFIAKTNPGSSSQTSVAGLYFGNQCLVSDTPAPIVSEETGLIMTPEEYLSGISNFIANANIDDVINTTLVSQFHTDNPNPPSSTSSVSWYTAQANAYVEQAYNQTPIGTCETTCNDKPLIEQAACELSCTKQCVQKCSDTSKDAMTSCVSVYATDVAACNQVSALKKPLCLASAVARQTSCKTQATTDNLLCISDCTCVLIAWPNGPGRQKMEDMFRIKFCKVPVQSVSMTQQKKVYSIQAIFQKLSDLLQSLKDSWQMIKYTKTKEFLDSNIKIKFADNFAFKILFWFKPVFSQKSTTVKAQEQAQANIDANIAVLNMNASAPTADDYTKYIVIADPATNAANKEPATTHEDIQANIDKFMIAAEKMKENELSDQQIDGVIVSYAQKNKIIFINNMIEFLKDNQSFLNNFSATLLDMNTMARELKTKIENSK